MAASANSVTQTTRYFLDEKRDSSGEALEETASKVAKEIFGAIRKMDMKSKREFVYFLKNAIKNSPSIRATLLCDKLSILTKGSWKEGLLTSYREDIIKVRSPFLCYSNDLNQEIRFKNRFDSSSGKEMAALFGSTFATNKKHRLDDQGHHLLDGAYGARCLNAKGDFSGFSLALADGAGGHFGDVAQDQRIAAAAYFGAKSVVRFFSAYHQADALRSDLSSILSSIKEIVTGKGRGEGSTLMGCRVFVEEEGFRFVGFNIGDSMMFAYDPSSKTVYSLLPSRVSEAGTAIFPTAYNSFEVHWADRVLPEGSLLFLLSDGAHDHLPYQEKMKKYPNDLSYRVRHLKDIELLFAGLSEEASIDDYLKSLTMKTIEEIDVLRKKSLSEETQIGDDVSLLGCRLTKDKKESTLFATFKTLFS